MSEFVYFTPQEKETARNADIAEMLERQGERLKRSGSEYEWGEGSERVTIRGNLWYHQYEQKGGNTVSFVQKFMDKTYVEAMKFILGDGAGEVKIMFKIYFPLAIKMIMTVFLIMFVSLWNDYQNPLIFLPTQPTLATAVYYMTNLANGTKESKIFAEAPAKMAASMVLALPILILFILTKNKLMGDISLGGIKE